MAEPIRLTQFSRGSGCGCKIAPAVLQEILQNKTASSHFPSLLVGNHTNDDAAVYDLGHGQALISTTDFFMPIVDDPYDFGRIAAANAISDVYAMGGKPIMAIAVLGWPVDKLPTDIAQQVLGGGQAICELAGIPLAGGHSIDTLEPIFGLAVNGVVPHHQLKKNNTAQKGDLLFLTKPIGTGILGTAMKRSVLRSEDYTPWINTMCSLNTIGAQLGALPGVTALTDVTGFGLLGHLIEMCEGSGLSAQLKYAKVPLLDAAQHYANQFIFPDNTYRNWNSFEPKVTGISGTSFITLCDPQTSGGLLIAVKPNEVVHFLNLMQENNMPDYAMEPIGVMKAKAEKLVEVIE